MKKILFAVVAISALTLSSCGIHETFSNNLTETKVVLSQNNFKVVGQAFGESKATYILGIGGLSRNSLKKNAINEMSKNANLSGSQTLTNVTTHASYRTVLGIWTQITVNATANIIEFK